MDVPHRAIALAGVEKRILGGGVSFPADLALNISVVLVHSSAVDFNAFFFELLGQRIK
jgi:hypothetical protein